MDVGNRRIYLLRPPPPLLPTLGLLAPLDPLGIFNICPPIVISRFGSRMPVLSIASSSTPSLISMLRKALMSEVMVENSLSFIFTLDDVMLKKILFLCTFSLNVGEIT
jgi:hypothetical protein